MGRKGIECEIEGEAEVVDPGRPKGPIEPGGMGYVATEEGGKMK